MVTTEPSPKDRFTSLDPFALVQELRRLRGARIDKVFDAGAGYSFLLRAPGRKAELTLVPGRFAALLPPATEHAETLSPFARELRRLLTGASVVRVADPSGERYLELELGRGADSGPTILAAELFGAGNLVVARDGKIAAVAHARKWAHRELRIGAEYARPPGREDPWTLSAARIQGELEGSRTDLASTLAARLALGGPVAEEVIARGGWSAQAPASTDAARLAARLKEILSTMVSEIGDAPKGYVTLRAGVAVDAAPYRSVRWGAVAATEESERATFSEAALEYFTTVYRPPPSAEEKAREAERESLRRLSQRQRDAATALREAAAERKSDADLLYAHYPEVEQLLAGASAGKEPPRSVEVTVGGRTITVVADHGVEGAARALYEEAKRLSAKLEGAEEALAATEARLASEEFRPRAPRAALGTPAPKVRWFDKYRWFVSSDGVLVIAGKDAASNDVVVRRHLKDGDVYVHADLQGAASVVVKRPAGGAPIPPTTLREAAQWAVAFSKAWRAGLASASAFWADPDQVSKSPESGEFVAKGAWIIRGTKHFERDLPLELALGTVRYDDEDRWTVAPPTAVRARGVVRVLLTPGPERDRPRLEEELARELGLSRSLLQRLLPAGGLSVRRA